MTTENKQKLIDELAAFGLNPQDWILHRIGTLQFKLKNRQDPDFILVGQGEFLDTRPKWKQIQLWSL